MSFDLHARLATSLSGTYSLERELGGGGMSRVFVAEETALGRKVVVKVLAPELAEGLSGERFVREIRLAARLQQANIVPVLQAGELEGLPYYTMPYVRGESLRARLAEGPLPTTLATGIIRDVAKALAYAHAEGVVHRDIKPENVLLSGGTAVVTDFGIAKAISASRDRGGAGAPTLTGLGTSLGTPAYMAPEQAAGDPDTDARADIYAWGVMAYELLAGRHPFVRHRTAHDLVRAHMTEAPAPLGACAPGVPAPVCALVMRCLAKAPADRPSSASELLASLDAAAGVPAGSSREPLGLWRALLVYTVALIVVGGMAKLATMFIGLPMWVTPGALGVMALGLPLVILTALVDRQRHGVITTPSSTGTVARIATAFPRRFTWRRTTIGAALAVALFVAGVAGYMAMRSMGVGPFGSLIGARALASQDRIVIADMRGPASDTALGIVLAEGMRAALSESRALRLVSTERVAMLLRQMERAGAALTPETARDVAVREGAKAVLDGDVRKVGASSVLTIRLLPAAGGDPLATLQETARDDADFTAAAGRLAKKLRARVGESLRSVNAMPPLETVTTASLPALRKYTDAQRAMTRGDYDAADAALSEAIAIDSNFAVAYGTRGSLLAFISGTRDAQVRMLERAFALRERVTPGERLMIELSYWQYGPRPDRARAVAIAQELRATYPDYTTAGRRLILLHIDRQHHAEAVALGNELLDTDSSFVEVYYYLAVAHAELGQHDSARIVLGRWMARGEPHPVLAVLVAQVAVTDGNDSLALDMARRLEAVTSQPLVVEWGAAIRGEVLRRQGRYREAYAAIDKAMAISDARKSGLWAYARPLNEAFDRARYLDGAGGARRVLDAALPARPLASIAPRDRNHLHFGAVYRVLGDAARLRATIAAQQRDDPDMRSGDISTVELLQAHLAEVEGRPAEAIAIYRRGMTGAQTRALIPFLADAYLLAGQKDSAVAYYEKFVESKSLYFAMFYEGAYLAHARQRLAQLYEERGEFDRAYAMYAALADQWRNADAELQPAVRGYRERMRALERRRGG